jgi:hypothetical protein
MPTNKAVVDIVEEWSGKRPEKMSQNLKDWWNQTAPGSTHSALAFDPDGIEDLLKRLKKAFPSSPPLVSGDFGDSGNIKTVQDLVDALQPAMAADEAVATTKRAAKKGKKAAGGARKTAKGKKKRPAKKARRRKKT